MTTLEEIKNDTKRQKEGVICVVDRCHAVGTGSIYELDGEFCAECECGLAPAQLNGEEVDCVRLKFGDPILTAN